MHWTRSQNISDFINNLSASASDYLEKEMKSISFQKGEVIIKKGQDVGGVYIVNEGELRIYTLDPNGIEKPIDNLNPGKFVYSL